MINTFNWLDLLILAVAVGLLALAAWYVGMPWRSWRGPRRRRGRRR